MLPPLDASSSLVCPDANPVLPCSPLPFNSLLRVAAAALPSTASERVRGIRGKRAPGVLLEVLRGKNSRLLFLVLRVLGLQTLEPPRLRRDMSSALYSVMTTEPDLKAGPKGAAW